MKAFFIVLLFPIHAFTQDISGVWKGHLYNDTTKQFMPYELAINADNEKLNAYSYTVFLLDSFKNIGIKTIKLKDIDGKYFLEDDKLIFNNYKEPPAKGVRMYAQLSYSKNDTSEILSGSWSTNRTKDYNPLTGSLLLKKANNEKETAIVHKLDEIGLAKKLSFLKEEEQKKPEISSVAVNEKSHASKNVPPVLDSENAKIVALNANKNQPKIIDEAVKKEENGLLAVNEKNKESNKQKNQLPVKEENKKVIESGNLVSKKDSSDSLKNVVAINEKNNKKSAASVNQTNQKSQEKVSPEQNKKSKSEEELKQIATANKQKIEKNIELPKKEMDQPENKKLPIKIDAVVKVQIPETPPAAQIATRKIETIRTVDISKDSLVLSLFDNGVVDGDTVTVLVNGKVVWPKVALREQSVNKTIYLTPEMGDSISVVMYAENLGTIAPNTGLLVVREGGKDHEIRFSGDLKKNSAIILKRKRQEDL
jgi:hypothetical protein